MSEKVDWKKDKKIVDDYIRHIENRVKTGQDVSDVKFTAMSALHEMVTKVAASPSYDARLFWAKNLLAFRVTIDFVDKLFAENNEINSYNEYNYELNKKLAEKNKELQQKVDQLTKILEERME